MKLANKKILIVGASSDLASSLRDELYGSNAIIGFHYNSNKDALSKYEEGHRIKKFHKKLNCSEACYELIDEFVGWAEGIDCLVQLSGDIAEPVHWKNLTKEQWQHDLSINLTMPFFLTQRAVRHMQKDGGRIILTSTASAAHGGGTTSLAYGIAKAGIECMIKGLARDCAKHNILVNAIAPGFIMTKFHTEKMKRTPKQLKERAELIPLKRAGTTREIAGVILFLLSEAASYVTGQVITVSGGDWL